MNLLKPALFLAAATLSRAEPSGPQWVPRFPGSRSTADLRQPFQGQVEGFLAALRNAGASIHIQSTYRPPERQHLMHWAWRIAREGYLDTQAPIPACSGVAIEWHWRDAEQHFLREASIEAATQMVNGYGLCFRPALTSRHVQRRAIDCRITWQDTLRVLDQMGHLHTVTGLPRDGHHPDLHPVGATYGVFKLVTDCPHWSDDGH